MLRQYGCFEVVNSQVKFAVEVASLSFANFYHFQNAPRLLEPLLCRGKTIQLFAFLPFETNFIVLRLSHLASFSEEPLEIRVAVHLSLLALKTIQ